MTSLVDRRALAILGIVLAVVTFIALNIFGTLSWRHLRLDLTERLQFTLSDGTEKLLAEIEEPITLRLYASRSLRDANPFLGTYADQVHDLLKTYADTANGRITVEFIDPEPFSPEEDRAVGFGLQGISADGGATTGYLGIAGTNSTDDVDVIPVLSPEREGFLEYDLTRMVYNLAHPEKPVIALISSLPINGDPAMQYRSWAVFEELGQFFEVRTLGGDVEALDADVDLLMLVHPQGLSEKTQYAIDQFVMRGGRALVFVDPHSEAQAVRQQQPGVPGDTFSSLDRLFGSWGIGFATDQVVADPNAARQVAYPSGGREQIIDYLPWLSLDRTALNPDEVVTAELNRVNLGTSGFLTRREGATTTFTPLVSSSPAAAAIAADKVRMFPDPFAIIREFQPGDEPLVLAALVGGDLKSAFETPPEGATGEHLAQSQTPARLIVVADTDLLDDRNWLANQSMLGQQVTIPLADNAGFVANALDTLSGSDALTALRGREVTLRPFTKVAEIRRAAETQYRAKEQELLQKLGDLQQKLGSLQVTETGDAGLVSAAQEQEIEGFRSQLLDTRRELRDVQHALRKDIEDLRWWTAFANIALVPLIVAALAIVLAVIQRIRYRRRFDAAAA